MNSNNDNKRRWSVEDDAYNDLLNSYFDKKPERPEPYQDSARYDFNKTEKKSPKTSDMFMAQKPKDFKVDIKNLDNEFNASNKKKTVAGGVPRAQFYKKAESNNSEKKSQKTPRREHTDTMSTRQTQSRQQAILNEYRHISSLNEQAENENNRVKYSSRIYKDQNGNTKVKKKLTKKDMINFVQQNKKAWTIILVCIICAVTISCYTISCMNDILAINRNSEDVVTINLPSDTNTREVIDLLKDNGLIKHKFFCTAFAKAMDYRDDNYLTGIYYMTDSMGLENMLSSFKKPMVSGETVTLTFPEGYTINQIAEKLAKYEVCSTTALYTTMRDVDFSSEYSFVAEEDNKDKRYQLLEGYFYPDTYDFYVGENASSVIRKFLSNFQSKWTDEYQAQAQKLGMSVDDVITLASIIEKEAYGADQAPLVSSVLHNRLNKTGLFPSLQCDSTTAYINEYIAKNVTDATSLSKFTQNYSTYKCEGLPVGAICNPGDDSINAALYPKSTNYYFFMHDNNKKLYLASNDSEHRANGIEVLKANSKKDS